MNRTRIHPASFGLEGRVERRLAGHRKAAGLIFRMVWRVRRFLCPRVPSHLHGPVRGPRTDPVDGRSRIKIATASGACRSRHRGGFVSSNAGQPGAIRRKNDAPRGDRILSTEGDGAHHHCVGPERPGGAGFGAELGSMKITEQIDAMEASAVDPYKCLAATRVLACMAMLPLLTLAAISVASSWAGWPIRCWSLYRCASS